MTPLRARLMNPPNAVPDTGITMRNGWAVKHVNNVVQLRPAGLPKPMDAMSAGKLTAEFWLPWDRELLGAPVIFRGTVYSLIRECAAGFHMSREELLSRTRSHPIMPLRRAAIAIVRRFTVYSLSHIGRAFGGYDHTTVVCAIRKMQPHIDAVATELPADAPVIEWARAMKRRVA